MSLPNVPTLPMSGDLRKWAAELTAYLNRLQQESVPRPVNPQLMGLMPDAKAQQDGILAWDRGLGSPVVSDGGAWLPIANSDAALMARIAYLEAATGAFGGMRLNTPGTAAPTLTSTFSIITVYNEIHVPLLNTVFDTTNNWFIVNKVGIYTFYLGVSFTHNADPNSTRALKLRLRNLDSGFTSVEYASAVPEKITGTTVTATIIASLTASSLGQRWVVEEACNVGDTFTGVSYYNAVVSLVLSGALP